MGNSAAEGQHHRLLQQQLELKKALREGKAVPERAGRGFRAIADHLFEV